MSFVLATMKKVKIIYESETGVENKPTKKNQALDIYLRVTIKSDHGKTLLKLFFTFIIQESLSRIFSEIDLKITAESLLLWIPI